MRSLPWIAAAIAVVASTTPATAQYAETELPEERQNNCVTCHGNPSLMTGELARLYVTESDLAGDIHWQKGLRCNDCHGGDANEVDFRKAHFKDSGFRAIRSPKDIPGFCGHCHSDPQFMLQYQPSPRTDQEEIYWHSGHGLQLNATGDDKVATCVSCHGSHDVRAVDDLLSPVYPTRVADTCGHCHGDPQWMAGREFHGRPIGHNQVSQWKKSIHGRAMLEKSDLSAPTCNDCHGNHGALASDVGTGAHACGTCHVKVAQLFSQTMMKHRFEKVELPGCATCHGEHDIRSPSDEMLGMDSGAVCMNCHNEGQYGATFLGAQVAVKMRSGLDQLKNQIASAHKRLDEAERLGMEVRAARFRLREASDALTNSRTMIHSFALDPVQEALKSGLQISSDCEQAANAAIQEHTNRRIWLGLSLVPIFVVVGVLLLYIRTLPTPTGLSRSSDQ